MPSLDVLGVRSDVGESTSTSDGFSVAIPAPPVDADSDVFDRHTQARVDIDLALPADFKGDLFGHSAAGSALIQMKKVAGASTG